MLLELDHYDHILVTFSGGKDSLVCLLELIDRGVDRKKLELWHHDVDGDLPQFMDWVCTPGYCRAVAMYFSIPIYFSWRQGGFYREMHREQTPTGPVVFETPDGIRETGGKGPLGTRLKFPQVSADLSVRWCSAYLKIDVMSAAINNQERFVGKKILVITGERAQESTARSRYQVTEEHRTSGKKRLVHQHRPVLQWNEHRVWDKIQDWSIQPHPAYELGWGRTSCSACIFGSANQWASLRVVYPEQFERIASLEEQFGKTIQRKLSIRQLADRGTPYKMDPFWIEVARQKEFTQPVILHQGAWRLPPGAFGESAGPT